MDEIHFITTGGTIDKQYSTHKGTRDLSIGNPAVKRIIDRIPRNIHFNTTELFHIDSLDIKPRHRHKILKTIKKISGDNIIITHGTDTMVETARYLESNLNNKSIVLVGSSKPEIFKNSDADFNVGAAIATLDMINNSIKIVMHGKSYDPNKVVKKENGDFDEIRLE